MFKIETHKVKGSAFDFAEQMIKAQGSFKIKGSGSYANVYVDPSKDYVYKMYSRDYGYDCYLKFLQSQKQQNPFAPKVYAVRVLKGTDGSRCTVVCTEKLKPFTTKGQKHKGERMKIFRKAEFLFEKYYQFLYDSDGIYRIKSSKDKLVRLVEDLYAFYGTKHCGSPDIHKGNLMLRGNQVVITDPLY